MILSQNNLFARWIYIYIYPPCLCVFPTSCCEECTANRAHGVKSLKIFNCYHFISKAISYNYNIDLNN